jgi:hypothetical protein
MSERTFRVVVAAVLIGFLALAIVAVVWLVPRSAEPTPSAPTSITPAPSHSASSAPTRIPIPPFASPEVVGVGVVPRGATSTRTLELRFIESSVDAIPGAKGSFRVTLNDSTGDGSTLAFVGTPSVDAPGSLGVTASLLSPGALLVSIESSDPLNVEPITISGLAIEAYSAAPAGSIDVVLDKFTGSLALGVTGNTTISVGTVGEGS